MERLSGLEHLRLHASDNREELQRARHAFELAAQGRVRRGYLGITSQPVILPEAQREAAGQPAGLLLIGVEEGSPAARAGLLIGDVLLGLDGHDVTESADLQGLLSGERVGREVEASLLRGGSRQSVRVTIAEKERR